MSAVCVYVPDLPDFAAILAAARGLEGCTVAGPRKGYWIIEGASGLQFARKPMKLGPALWYSMLSGGFRGRIVEFDRDRLVIVAEGDG